MCIYQYSIQMDEGKQAFYSPKHTNKQIRTYTNLQTTGTEKLQKQADSIRQSYRSSNNLHMGGIHASQRLQQPRYSDLLYSSGGYFAQSKSISKPKLRYKIKSKSSLNDGEEDEDDDYTKEDRDSYRDQSMLKKLNEVESEKQTIKLSNDRLSRYENIVTITQRQNKNLKEHNKYLLEKLRKMQQRQQKIKKLYNKTKQYKSRWIQLKNQIQIIKQESHIYRALVHDFKEITMIDIPVLKQKVEQTKEAVEEDGFDAKDYEMRKNGRNRVERLSSRGKDKNNSGEWNNIKERMKIEEIAEEADQKTFRDDESPISKLNSTNDKNTGQDRK